MIPQSLLHFPPQCSLDFSGGLISTSFFIFSATVNTSTLKEKKVIEIYIEEKISRGRQMMGGPPLSHLVLICFLFWFCPRLILACSK